MNVHKNARLTPHSRAELVRRVLGSGQSPKAVATAFGVDVKTVKKWVEELPATGSSHEFEVWRRGFLVDLTEGAFYIAMKNGVKGFPLEVELEFYRVFRLVLKRYTRPSSPE